MLLDAFCVMHFVLFELQVKEGHRGQRIIPSESSVPLL